MNFPHRDADGKIKVYPTRRPEGTVTFFCGSGDDLSDPENPIIGGGEKLQFDMTTEDAEKSVGLVFCEDVYLKDGYAIFENAPFGSNYDIEVWDPTGTNKLSCFARNCSLLGTGHYTMNSDDISVLPQGYILRVVVSNSAVPQAFKVIGHLEVFRATTV